MQTMVDQAEIHRKVVSDEVEEHREAVEQLRDNFADLPDTRQAWKDLHRLTGDEDDFVRWGAADTLGRAFQHIPNKDAAWKDLHRLTEDEDRSVRWGAANALGIAFQHVPDKDAAWKDLHRLTGDEDIIVRWGAADALGIAFQHVPDKKQVWKDLIRLTGDEDSDVRWHAANALGIAFQHVPDKDTAWEDLHRLTGDEDSFVRSCATNALGIAFQHVPDKGAAWNDLHRLTGDEDSGVRSCATNALGTAFQHVPDKDAAWEDLHRLTGDEDSFVREGAANALRTAFQHVPDKEVAWKDLHRLTADEESYVRASANHSLGRASIFRATVAESEEDFESELNNAIDFFERSSKEATYPNPSKFCLPFYRSFYSLTFGKAGAEDEVQKYLADAKSASEGSANKEMLLEAVENLANALSEVQKVTNFGAMKSDLNTYRRYCNRAADLIGDVAEGAPGAARILRRGLPIIGERIREIQEKAEALCRETRGTGTPYEPLGMAVNKWAGELSDRGYLRGEKDVSRIRDLLGKLCNLVSEDERDYPCKIVEEIREEREPEDNLSDVVTALSYLVPSIKSEIQNAAKPTTDKTESHRTAIEISADIAVHVLVYTVLHYFAEDMMPVLAPILVLSALIILLLIIRNAKS